MQQTEIRAGADATADSHDVNGAEQEVAAPEDRNAMIALMRRYRAAKQQLEEEEDNGRAYVQLVQDEVKESLRPLKEELERIRRSMDVFVRERNGGKSFSVPALGTAYTQNRLVSKIVDPDEFLKVIARADPEKADELCDRKLNASRARKEAERAFKEDGERVAGADVEQVTVLCFKTPSTAAPVRARATGAGG